MYRWKTILVLFISLWLPVQGYGAVAMPFCAHGTGTADIINTDPGDNHVGHDGHQAHAGHGMVQIDPTPAGDHAAGPGSDAQTAGDRSSNLACNDCGACHLACAPTLISPATALPPRNTTVFALPDVQPLLSVTPERLQRPPLTALA